MKKLSNPPKKRGRKSNLVKRLGATPDYILNAPKSELMEDFAQGIQRWKKEILETYKVSPTVSLKLAAAMADVGDPEFSSPENDKRVLTDYERILRNTTAAPQEGGAKRGEGYQKKFRELLLFHESTVAEFLAGELTALKTAEVLLTLEEERRQKESQNRAQDGAQNSRFPKALGLSTLRAYLENLKSTST